MKWKEKNIEQNKYLNERKWRDWENKGVRKEKQTQCLEAQLVALFAMDPQRYWIYKRKWWDKWMGEVARTMNWTKIYNYYNDNYLI